MKEAWQRILEAKARYNVALRLPWRRQMAVLIWGRTVLSLFAAVHVHSGLRLRSTSSDRSWTFSAPFLPWASRMRCTQWRGTHNNALAAAEAWYSAYSPMSFRTSTSASYQAWRRIHEGVHFSGGLRLLKRLSQQDACVCQISCHQASRRLKAPQFRHPHSA
jgi:hypothetical protein